MRTSISLRWLVVAVSAAMLLAFSAACGTETIEVPGQTVVVEKVVTQTVEVPGETVVKEVEVPVVVEKEVIRVIEVPAEPAEPIAMAADQIVDPKTGKMINPPQYGGSISYAIPFNPGFFDPQFGWAATRANSPIFEKLLIADWTVPFKVNPFDNRFYIGVPEHTANWLAESYEISPDLLTYTFNIRPGVHYHRNDNIEWNGENGRESNAYDWEHSWQRTIGLGPYDEEEEVSGFVPEWVGVPVESVTATDNYTLEFKFSQPVPLALGNMIHPWHGGHVYPKEVVEQQGDFQDWRYAIGTGSFSVVSYDDAVAITYEKNPDYWANDPLFPEYQLPYLDSLKAHIIPEAATRLAALRTAKLDWERRLGPDQATALLDSHPQLVYSTGPGPRGLDMAVNVTKSRPWRTSESARP